MWHGCLIFHDILKKNKKKNGESGGFVERTYASDQLIKGVSWRSVNQNCALVVFEAQWYAA